jgi:membrane protein
VNLLISLAVSALVFVLIFNVIPDVKIAWSDVWIGAASTSVLFTLGRFLIGFYLGHSNVASVYGAAASLIILLTWIYYSANVLLLGAEFTQVYADQLGSRIVPKEGAAPMTSERRAQQGIDTEKSVKTSGIRTSKGHGEGTGKKHKRGLLMGILDRALDLYYIWKGRVGR